MKEQSEHRFEISRDMSEGFFIGDHFFFSHLLLLRISVCLFLVEEKRNVYDWFMSIFFYLCSGIFIDTINLFSACDILIKL